MQIDNWFCLMQSKQMIEVAAGTIQQVLVPWQLSAIKTIDILLFKVQESLQKVKQLL
jgi:hypothetical protein